MKVLQRSSMSNSVAIFFTISSLKRWFHLKIIRSEGARLLKHWGWRQSDGKPLYLVCKHSINAHYRTDCENMDFIYVGYFSTNNGYTKTFCHDYSHITISANQSSTKVSNTNLTLQRRDGRYIRLVIRRISARNGGDVTPLATWSRRNDSLRNEGMFIER